MSGLASSPALLYQFIFYTNTVLFSSFAKDPFSKLFVKKHFTPVDSNGSLRIDHISSDYIYNIVFIVSVVDISNMLGGTPRSCGTYEVCYMQTIDFYKNYDVRTVTTGHNCSD